MNLNQLQSSFKLGELATTPAFQAVINFLRSTPPRGRGVRDATTIIHDEGRAQGWHECLDLLENIHRADIPTNYRGQKYLDPNALKPETDKKS